MPVTRGMPGQIPFFLICDCYFSAFRDLKAWHGMTVLPSLMKSPPPGSLEK
ncbi:Uncharacterised protein [Klebsiella quasipneumoniae]|nr:Uncharacterised protein [Klebsiella quasipneumoniae]